MILSHINDHYPCLKTQDTLSRAKKLFEQFQINLLAVIDKGQFLGFINPETLQQHFPEQKIADILPELKNDHLFSENDLLSAIPIFEKYQATILPVVDEQKRFLGYLTFDTLGKEMILTDLNLSIGGIIKIQFHQQRDSLSQIIRIIEENNGLVVKSFIKDQQTEQKLSSLVLQIKTEQLGKIIQHLERHGYFIEHSIQLVGEENLDHSRYDSLMKYLTI